MGGRTSRAQRRERARTSAARMKRGQCIACGKPGPHYVPPSLGDEGFFMCTQVLLDGKAVPK